MGGRGKAPIGGGEDRREGEGQREEGAYGSERGGEREEEKRGGGGGGEHA